MSKEILKEEFTWIHPTKGQVNLMIYEENSDQRDRRVKVVIAPVERHLTVADVIDEFLAQLKNLGKWERYKELKNELDKVKQ